jgi:predicted permease
MYDHEQLFRGESRRTVSMRNLRFALRTLFRTPFLTTVAVLSLAFGIGANTAIFSLFNQMLLQPLPVQAPAELVNLSVPGPKPGSQSCNQAGGCDDVFSYPMFRDLERGSKVFSGLAAHRVFGANLSYQGQTLNGEGMLVSGSYFPTLGVAPALGRLLGQGDDQAIGQSPVAVLSHDYWVTRFGADSSVLNKTILVNGQSMTIVGVGPARFSGTTLGSRPQVYVPITMRGLLQAGFNGFDNRRSYWAYVFGRLAPGQTIESAQAALSAQYRAIVNDVEAPLQTGMSEATMKRFREKPIVLTSGVRGQSDLHEEAGTPLKLLFAVTGVVLLIACANIANLLLARSAARANEMAVRLSIGASRSRLIGQLLLESCLLALFGGLAGLLVAKWTLTLIGTMLPADAAATLVFQLDWAVLGFAATLSIGTGLLFGLFPAIHSTRPDLATTLKGTSGQPSGARSAAFFRKALVVSQMSLSMALLASAGLFTKSLFNVSRVDLGVEIEHLVTFSVAPELNGYSADRSKAIFEQLEDELKALPGVTSATGSLVPLLAGSSWGTGVRVQGFTAGPDVDNNSRYNEVAPDYFSTLGVPLLAGREFTRADRKGAAKVAIVNEAFAKKFGLGRNAVGMLMSQSGGNAPMDIEIVGLVQDAKYSEVKDTVPPLFFTPYRQDDGIGSMSFYIRTAIDPEQFLRSITAVVSKVDANLPVVDLRTMPQQVRENVFLDRFISTMSAAFAMLATLLAAIGLYGVLAFTVTQRTREFGLRMALGADGANVRWLVLKQVGWMAVLGGALGLAMAWAIGGFAESQLFEMKGRDPVVFGVALVVLGLVALTAGFVPALRASRVNPMTALRWE